MIEFHAFLNTDSPAVVKLWNSQPSRRALRQPLTLTLLEESVLGKPYFDRHGFVVAKEGGRLIGFAHAGFGPTPDGSELSTEVGAVHLAMVAGDLPREAVVRGLLERGEAYLAGRGARTLWAGCLQPVHGFYLGLYGGSESPGVLESDAAMLALFRTAGYAEVERQIILQRPLAGFRAPVDRQQLQLRRQYHVESEANPACKTWWEAWTMGQFERVRQRLFQRQAGEACGSVMTWCRERPLGSLGAKSVGLMGLEIQADQRARGLGVFLVGEALRGAQENGASLAEVQVAESNVPALAVFRKLGFQQVDRGWVLRRGG